MPSITTPCIGTIFTPFKDLEHMPIQPVGAKDVEGHIEILPEFVEGLLDLEGFSHVYLLYHFHKADRVELNVKPYLDKAFHGVFSTRSPLRPAHIGLSVVDLLSIEGTILRIRGVDILDGTPLLDIKPYVPQFDQREDVRTGWMCKDKDCIAKTRSDRRFA